MLALAYSFSLFLIWFVVGRALVAGFAPRFGILRSWLLAPGVGLAAFLLGLMFLNQSGLPIGRIAWPLTGGLLVAAAAVFFWRRPLAAPRAVAPFVLAALASLFWTGWPALESGFNWISYGNDDMANYCLAAQRFADHGFYDIPSMADLSGRDYAAYYYFMHVADMMRFGAEHLVAWSASLAGLKPTQAFMPVILALALAQVLAVAGLVLQAGRFRRHALATAWVLAAMPLFMLGTLYQLIAQVAGVTLMLVTLALLTRRWGRVTRRTLIGYAVLPSLTSAALCITYPETTPFTGAAYAAYVALGALRRRGSLALAIGLTAYALVGIVALLRFNLISYVSVLVMQATSALHAANLLLSLFPYFLLPTGFANLFGWMPIARDFPEPVLSLSILAGLALALGVLWRALTTAWQLRAASVLLLVQCGAAVMLYRGANDFGLYKLAMWMQPALAAMLAGLILSLTRSRAALAAGAIALFAASTAPTALSYTRASQGLQSGGLTELRFGSRFGMEIPAPQDRDAQITATIENVVAAKFAASELRGRQLALASRDYFFPNTRVDFRNPPLPVLFHPHFDEMAAAYPLMHKRNRELITISTLWRTEFTQPVLARPTDFYLGVNRQLSLFNKFALEAATTGASAPPPDAGAAPAGEVFVVEPAAARANRVVFVHSGRGNHYYLGDRRRISFFQQEPDLFAPGRDFNGLGRFLLLRIERPSDEIYLRLAATRSSLQGRTAWKPDALVHASTDQPMGLVGNGAFNLFIGPLRPQRFEGAAYVAIDFREIAETVPDRRRGLKALYNRDIPLDYRRLIGWGRDISALSAADYRQLARPLAIARFPEDLAGATTLEFAGAYEDGWLSPRSRFVLGAAPARGVVRLRGFVPELPGTALGTGILKLTVDGRVTELAAGTGHFDWLVPVPRATEATALDLQFTASAPLPGGDERPAAAKIEALEVLPALPSRNFDYGTIGAPRLAARGIDQDGWAAPAASIELPALDAPTLLTLRIEYPGWTDALESHVSLHLPDGTATEYTLPRAVTTIRFRVPAAASPRTLRLEGGAPFKLPAPDHRARSYRLINLALAPEPAVQTP